VGGKLERKSSVLQTMHAGKSFAFHVSNYYGVTEKLYFFTGRLGDVGIRV